MTRALEFEICNYGLSRTIGNVGFISLKLIYIHTLQFDGFYTPFSYYETDKKNYKKKFQVLWSKFLLSLNTKKIKINK